MPRGGETTPKDRLGSWIAVLKAVEWAVLVVDRDWHLAWVSDPLKDFLDEHDDEALGVGDHIAAALTRDAWMSSSTPESQARMFRELMPFVAYEHLRRGASLPEVPERFAPFLGGIEPRELPEVFLTSFDYVSPLDPELPPYAVNLFLIRLMGQDDAFEGVVVLSFMGIRQNLLALLARGDEAMYERMARLVDPGTRQAAILFCDLTGSVELSRRLPSSGYFRLVRSLWTGIDAAVAGNCGIVGKHAGDGASAFFLVEDLGTPSGAARAAIATARAIHELSRKTFSEVLESPCLMRVGLHWGATLYMGQLVPGGRLDVTALGDEVNECARIQETAGHDQTLASKPLVEQLSSDDAAELGIDVEKLQYKLIGELAAADSKASRDAYAIPVTEV